MKLMYVKDLRKQFTALLAKLKVLMGLSSEMMPTGEEIEVMLNYALDNWHNQTIEEIELAVICNMKHENETYVDCYGKLSIKFLTDCLYHYRETKRKAVLEFNRRKQAESPKTIAEPDYIVNSKLYDGLIEFIRVQKRFPDFWDWNGVYKHMEENHLVDHISNDHKTRLYEQVKSELTGDRITKRMEARTLGDMTGADGLNAEDRIRKECRRRIIESILMPESN